jgi:Zn-dependent peptidase ImmA (M78 family)/DNA-binding XRE family transcriptional regulator
MSRTDETLQLNHRFFGDKLQLAREFRGLTQTELANMVSASAPTISLIETGKRANPSADLVRSFSDALKFPEGFFFQAQSELFSERECNFRHRRTTPEKLKTQIRARASLIASIIGELKSIFRFPELDVPTIIPSLDVSIERVAENCRNHWKLNIDAPILQPGRVIERAGIVIVAGLTEISKIDAFSRYGENALIFLNKGGQSPSRLHFDLGHELGHLVLHRGIMTGDKQTEQQADTFASCFLMPSRSFGRELRSVSFGWDGIFTLKRRWKVSAAAIIRRGFELGILNAIQYRRAFQDMSSKGWRRSGEPYEPDFQEPELLASALQVASRSSSIIVDGIAERQQISAETLAEIFESSTLPADNSLLRH